MSNMLAKRLDDLAREISQEVQACEASLTQGVAHALKAGTLLLEAKALIPHGAWIPFVERVGLTPRNAQRYMRVASRWSELEAKSDTVSHLSLHKALDLLTVAGDDEAGIKPRLRALSMPAAAEEPEVDNDHLPEHVKEGVYSRAAQSQALTYLLEIVAADDKKRGPGVVFRPEEERLIARFRDAWDPNTRGSLYKYPATVRTGWLFYTAHDIEDLAGPDGADAMWPEGECRFCCCHPDGEERSIELVKIFGTNLYGGSPMYLELQ